VKRSLTASAILLALGALAFTLPRRAPVVPYFAYISEAGTNYVSVHDMQTIGFPLVGAPIVVGSSPRGVAVVPSLNRVYVANNGGIAGITVIDTTTLSPVSTITPPNFAQGSDVIVSADQQWVFVSGQDTSSSGGVVHKISTATNAVVESVVISINGPSDDLAIQTSPFPAVYATHANGFVVAQIRYASGFASLNTGVTESPFSAPAFIDVAPDGTKAYLTRRPGISPAPEVVGTGDWSVVAPIGVALAGVPNGVSTGDDYNEVRFLNGTPNSIAYVVRNFVSFNEILPIDATTDQGTGTPANTGTGTPNTISIDPTNTLMIVGTLPFSGDSTVEVFDITTPNAPVSIGLISGITGGWRAAFGPPNPKPFITEASEHGGLAAAGSAVRILGGNFSAAAAVDFEISGSPVPAAGVTVLSSSEILAFSPGAGGVQRSRLFVTNGDGQQASLPAMPLMGGWYLFTNNATSNGFTVLPGTTQAQYRMFSVPQITTWSQFITSLESTFGPYDPQVWRAFWWDAERQAYHELTTPPSNPADVMGTCVWILSRFGGNVSVPGLDSEYTQPPLYVALKPGWNLFAWPIDGTGPGEWQTGGANPVNVTQDFATSYPASLANPLVNSILYEWDGTQYLSVNQVEIGKGYWVYNATSGVVYLSCYDTGWKPGDAMLPPVKKALAPGDLVPPPPPGGAAAASSSSRPDCSFAAPAASDPAALAGLALLVLIAAIRLLRRC
jgi:DNA-binding beta-propeller fold protein YncE